MLNLMTSRVRNGLYTLVTVAGSIIVWWAIAVAIGSDAVMPGPREVLVAFLGLMSNELPSDIAASLARVVLGLTLGSFLGVAVGIVTGAGTALEMTLGRLLNFLRAMTPVALGPFFIVWFGIGEVSKIALISWGVFFPVWVATHIGTQNVEPRLIQAGQTIGYKRHEILTEIVIFASLPNITAGVRTAIGIAYILVFVSESLGASSGVGYRLAVSYDLFRTDQMIASLIVLGVLGALSDATFVYLIRRFFPWLVSSRR